MGMAPPISLVLLSYFSAGRFMLSCGFSKHGKYKAIHLLHFALLGLLLPAPNLSSNQQRPRLIGSCCSGAIV
jgi:hypothetical protein